MTHDIDKRDQNEYIDTNQKEGSSMTESDREREKEEALAMAEAWKKNLERIRSRRENE